MELAGSLLAYDDELETSAEGGSAKSLSTFKLARPPLNIHDDRELLADPHRVKCQEEAAGRRISSGCVDQEWGVDWRTPARMSR